MTSSEDYLPLITPPEPNFGYRQGIVVSWDPSTGNNEVQVAGTNLRNLPLITTSDLVNIRGGDPVAILTYNDSYAVLGKIRKGVSGTPWDPVPLYPLFVPLLAAGTTGYWSVNVGVLTSWEGRINATHYSSLELDGIWGRASGVNTVVYQVLLGGALVGTWTSTTLEVARKGPFDIAFFKDQPFLKLEVKITSSTGTGTVAHQVLGCFLR